MPKPEFAAHTPPEDDPNQEWHGLKEHLNAVAAATERFAEQLGAGKLGYYAGLWHDLGKYNPEFQKYLQNCHAAQQAGKVPRLEKIPHAVYGAILADEICPSLAPLIYGHHAGLPNYAELESRLTQAKWRKPYREVVKQAELELDLLTPEDNLDNTLTQKLTNELSEDVFTRLLFSCLIDADRLDTERFANPEQYQQRQQRANAVSIGQLWETFQQKQQAFVQDPQKPQSQVNRVRAEVYEHCLAAATEESGVFRLCVPTGGGKTRSGLAFALKHAVEKESKAGKPSRVIFAVPYTSIIEQTAQVYREEIFGELGDAAVLEHHSAIQAEKPDRTADQQAQIEVEEVGVDAQVQAKLATQNWAAPLIVTTTVQLFESLFSHKTSKCRKLHNLVNSVIVLDEVQTLPISLLAPILSMLKELVDRYEVTVVLCTATQPALEGDTPYFTDGFPLNSVCNIIPPGLARTHFRQLKRVHYEVPQPGETWTWQDLKDRLPQAQSALVVLNTRKDAIAVLDFLGVERVRAHQSTDLPREQVHSILQSAPALHLSTLLCGEHRRAILREVRRRLEHQELCTVVSTQVVEAGVDVDFPVVFRALGPLDRIVQAAGRCNREGKLNDIGQLGRVVIFEPAAGSHPPQGEYAKAMQKARSMLQDADFKEAQLHEPDIFQEYFRHLYTVCKRDPKGIQALRQSWTFRTVGEEFKLIEDNTVPVVVAYDETVRDLLREIQRRKLWSSDRAKLQPYMVNLPLYVFNQTQAKQEIATDLWQWMGSYDPIYGLVWDEVDVPVYGFLSV
jgi:CRISPR-associated endonuclease/helicase Cas3